MTWKVGFVQFSWRAHCFCHIEKNLRPVWRFWELWRSQMRFGQNVVRMTSKERFVEFWWKAHYFSVLKGIWGQSDDFENFDAQKCDLAKTCCAWPAKSVLYYFHGERTVLERPFSREFEASSTILRTLTLKNAIWPKRAPHDLKRAFCTIFMETALFSRFQENFRPVWRFWELWRSKMRFGQNVLRMTWKERFVQFSWKAHCFPVLKRILGWCDDFENFDALKCDLAKTCCAWPEKCVLKSTVFPFWREFEVSFTILRTFTLQKCDLAKTCSAWPEKSVLYNFYGKRTVFPFWREFEASFTILRTLTLKNANWSKRAPHDLKRAFCTIFMERALFSRFKENWRPWRFWKLWRSKMRFGHNVLRMTWKVRFVQFSWKAHCFPVLKRILGWCDDFENFDALKCDLAKTCCAWPEKCVLKSTVFPFWREFEVDSYRQIARPVIVQPYFSQSDDHTNFDKTSATSLRLNWQLNRRKQIPWQCFQ